MTYQYNTADVFTDRIFGGNQLAVFPDARGLSSAQMLKIAQEFNYSETTFVLPPDDPANTRKVRIFTPAREIPFAGHPTVGTAHVLAAIGEIPLVGKRTSITLEEGVGNVPVMLFSDGDTPISAQLTTAQLPEWGPKPDAETVAAVLGLTIDDLRDADGVERVSCGLPFIFVPVRNREVLNRARLNKALWEETLAGTWAQDPFVFCFDPELPGSDIRARMYGPSFSIEEDPATGSAASTLAGYLAARDDRTDGTLTWRIEQGFEMGRPSILDIEADKSAGELTALRVGGSTVIVMEGVMRVA